MNVFTVHSRAALAGACSAEGVLLRGSFVVVVVVVVVIVESRGRALELTLFPSHGACAGADIAWWR